MKYDWTRYLGIVVMLILAVALAACGSTAGEEEGKTLTTDSGLQYTEITAGDGPAPQQGDIVAVHYRGTLEDGTEFDSSYQRGQPIQFPVWLASCRDLLSVMKLFPNHPPSSSASWPVSAPWSFCDGGDRRG